MADVHPPAPVAALLFGVAIVAAAFLLSWAAEVAQKDISQALALAFVALIAVLPEYAVDFVFTWKAGQEEALGIPLADQTWVHYATANMTGANRLLVGVGWPLVALLFFLRSRRHLYLERGLSLELLFMGLATVYAFTIPLHDSIALWDAVVLVGLFSVYIWLSSRSEVEEPELVGPPALIGAMPPPKRRTATALLFLLSAGVIIASAEPFADGLVETGSALNIDEFILVQWVAPLASESPEILVAVIFTLKGNAAAAMTALVSAKVNQWTLLVGTLPLVYSASLGGLSDLPLDLRQNEEFLLTAAQSLFAVVLLVRLHMTWRGAVVLFLLFSAQLFSPLYPAMGPILPDPSNRHIYSLIYLALTGLMVVTQPGRLRALGRLLPAVANTARR